MHQQVKRCGGGTPVHRLQRRVARSTSPSPAVSAHTPRRPRAGAKRLAAVSAASILPARRPWRKGCAAGCCGSGDLC